MEIDFAFALGNLVTVTVDKPAVIIATTDYMIIPNFEGKKWFSSDR